MSVLVIMMCVCALSVCCVLLPSLLPFPSQTNQPVGAEDIPIGAVSRSTYAGLFSIIGTTWGTGDGSSTFNVPDLRGAV